MAVVNAFPLQGENKSDIVRWLPNLESHQDGDQKKTSAANFEGRVSVVSVLLPITPPVRRR